MAVVQIFMRAQGATLRQAHEKIHYITGAERRLARECVKGLEEAGFALDPERSDELPKTLLERFQKA